MAEHTPENKVPTEIPENVIRIVVNYNRFTVDGGIDSVVFDDLESVYSIFAEESSRLGESMKKKQIQTELEELPAPEQVLICGLFRDFCRDERSDELFNSVIPILVSAHATLNKAHFKQEIANRFIRINLADLMDQFGFDADQLAQTMGVEIVETNKPMRFTSIDDLPSYIPDEVKQQMVKLRDEAIEKGETGNSHMMQVTSEGTKLVSKEEYDNEFGEGAFEASLNNFKMDVEAMERGAHPAPKTIQ